MVHADSLKNGVVDAYGIDPSRASIATDIAGRDGQQDGVDARLVIVGGNGRHVECRATPVSIRLKSYGETGPVSMGCFADR
jgi:hypothetical protein